MKQAICLLFLWVLSSDVIGQVAIQSDKMNTMIRGIDNPITVVAADTKVSDLMITTINGKIEGKDGHYVIRPDSTGNTKIEVWKKTPKGTQKLGASVFSVKRFPDPVVTLYGLSGGNLRASLARVLIAPAANWRESDGLCGKQSITNISLIIVRDEKLVFMKTLNNRNGVRFTDDPEADRAIKSLKPGDKVLLANVKCSLMPDQIARPLNPAEFDITE